MYKTEWNYERGWVFLQSEINAVKTPSIWYRL